MFSLSFWPKFNGLSVNEKNSSCTVVVFVCYGCVLCCVYLCFFFSLASLYFNENIHFLCYAFSDFSIKQKFNFSTVLFVSSSVFFYRCCCCLPFSVSSRFRVIHWFLYSAFLLLFTVDVFSPSTISWNDYLFSNRWLCTEFKVDLCKKIFFFWKKNLIKYLLSG